MVKQCYPVNDGPMPPFYKQNVKMAITIEITKLTLPIVLASSPDGNVDGSETLQHMRTQRDAETSNLFYNLRVVGVLAGMWNEVFARRING